MKIFTHVFSHLYLGRENSATSHLLALAVIFVGLLSAYPVLAEQSCQDLNIARSKARSAICLRDKIIKIKNEITDLKASLEEVKKTTEPYACIMSIPGPEECAELDATINLSHPCAYERKIQCKQMELSGLKKQRARRSNRNKRKAKKTRPKVERKVTERRNDTKRATDAQVRDSRFRPVFCQNQRSKHNARAYDTCLKRTLARLKAEDKRIKDFMDQSPQTMMVRECPRLRATMNTFRTINKESRAILTGDKALNPCTLEAKQSFNAISYRLLVHQIRQFQSKKRQRKRNRR